MACRGPIMLTHLSFLRILFILWELLYLLAQNLQDSTCTFQPWNQPFLQSLGSFSGEWYLETKIWVWGVCIATGGVNASRPFQWTNALHKIFSDLFLKFNAVSGHLYVLTWKVCLFFCLYSRVWMHHNLTILSWRTFRLFPIFCSKNSGESVNCIIVTHRYFSLLHP